MDLYFPLTPKQIEFRQSVERFPITFYGGGKGSGKSHGLRSIFLRRCLNTTQRRSAIFRRSYEELEENHIQPLLEQFPQLAKFYHETKHNLNLPNGSRLMFRFCAREKDVDKYRGREYQDLGIDEAGEWTEEMFYRLLGSNRSSVPGTEPRCALTGNPGGIGHKWLRKKFVLRKFEHGENPKHYNFVRALLEDNPALEENDPGYRARLEQEKNETLRRAFLLGDWDIEAGQYFDIMCREIHLIEPFAIPDHWNRFGSYDYGFNHPAFWIWWAADEDGNVFIYRVLARSKMGIDEQARALNQHAESTRLVWLAGHDCWARKKGRDPTIPEEFLKYGIHLKQANIDRVQGAAQCRSYLSYRFSEEKGLKKRIGPRVFIFSTCEIVFDALTRMVTDPNNVEDVLKIDASNGDPWTGDDGYDCFRHGIMSRPPITAKPKPEWKDRYRGSYGRVETKSVLDPWV